MATSRRAFLAGLGGGIATTALAWTVWEHLPFGRGTGAHPIANYVDYGGWILTKADKDRLTAPGSLTRFEATTLEGRTLKDDVVPDVDSCSVWCLGEPDCQGFTYATVDHRCTLKATSDLRRSANPAFVSGIR